MRKTRQEQYRVSKQRSATDPEKVKRRRIQGCESMQKRRADQEKAPIITEQTRQCMARRRAVPEKAVVINQQARQCTQRARADPEKASTINKQARQSMERRRADPEKATIINNQACQSMEKRRADPEKAPLIHQQACKSMEKRRADPTKAKIINQQSRLSAQKRRADPQQGPVIREQARESMKRRRANPEKSQVIHEQTSDSVKRARKDPLRKPAITEQTRNAVRQFRSTTNYNKGESNISWPQEISKEMKSNCITEYKKATSFETLRTKACGVCGVESINTTIVEVDCLPNKHLLQELDTDLEQYKHFGLVLEPSGIVDDGIVCCTDCLKMLKANKLPCCSVRNGLQLGMTPHQLQDLTIAEKLIIPCFRPSICIVKFKEIAGPGTSQKGVKGNTITFQQDVSTVTKKIQTLPHDVNTLCDNLKVVFTGSKRPSKKQLQNVLQIRRSKVLGALQWLKKHHVLYRDINISTKNVNKLPQGEIPECVWQTMSSSVQKESKDKSKESYNKATVDSILDELTSCDKNNTSDIVMQSSGIIDVDFNSLSSKQQTQLAAKKLLNDEKIRRSSTDDNEYQSKEQDGENVLIVPHHSCPTVEYKNPNLWTGSYPWLFPYGRGGAEDSRQSDLSLRKWIKHLLEHVYNRFREDHAFFLHVYNVIRKREVSLYTALSVRQRNFTAKAGALSSLSSVDLERALESLAEDRIENEAVKLLLKEVQVVGSHIPGTGYARRNFRLEIQGLMIKLGQPAFFLTLNPADVHSPVLLFLAGHEVNLDDLLPPRE